MANFDQSVNIVFKHEGGFVDTLHDAGGATKYGISSARYPNVNIKSLTLNQAKDIYKRDFWNKFRLNELHNQQIANLALDMIVLHGQGVRLIQKGLVRSGKGISIDNRIGSETIGALNAVNPSTFINNTVKVRKEYMQSLVDKNPSQIKFLKGWHKRADFFLTSPMQAGTSLLLIGLVGYGIFYYLKNRKK